ncbi:MAG: transposase [Actinomycetota bacterium]|nr:transposase [Actinomycetota bacterium]
MPRKPRIDLSGQLYHVTVRGNNKEDIFIDKSDRDVYCKYLRKAKEKYCFFLYCYVLMNNHVHLLLRPTEKGAVSKIMQSINTGYTMYFNYKYKKCGHRFQGRYKSFLVEEEPHFLELLRYIHQNPVRAEIARRVEDYPYSSYFAYFGKAEDKLVDIGEVLSRFGARESVQIKRFKVFIEDIRERNIYRPERFMKDGLIVGSEEFKNKIFKLQVNSSGKV